jgi:hypothetical protein
VFARDASIVSFFTNGVARAAFCQAGSSSTPSTFISPDIRGIAIDFGSGIGDAPEGVCRAAVWTKTPENTAKITAGATKDDCIRAMDHLI